jgi:hypothetical protein
MAKRKTRVEGCEKCPQKDIWPFLRRMVLATRGHGQCVLLLFYGSALNQPIVNDSEKVPLPGFRSLDDESVNIYRSEPG